MTPHAPEFRGPRRLTFKSVCALLVASVASHAALAATFRVDDSLTLPHNAQTRMQWKSAAPTRAEGNLVEGAVIVTIRLNLAPWLNKNGQIYMTLPPQPTIGPVTAEWTTQGRLLPGKVVSGERTLVFSGPIRSTLIEETLHVKVQADGARLAMPQQLEFIFEIDVN